MKERNRKIVCVTLLSAIMISMIVSIQAAEPKIRVTQSVTVDKWTKDQKNEIAWSIGEISRIGPGGYAPITWCIQNEDEDFSLKGYYVTFVLDPELTMGGIDWETLKKEANSETGYRWTFGDNFKYAFANTYILALAGNYARDFYNIFTTKDAEKIDLNVVLAITDQEPENPDFFSKFLEENIFGVTAQIPDLEPVKRSGRHSWCVEEGIKRSWYDRTSYAPQGQSSLQKIKDETVYALPYIVVGRDAQIGDKHKIAALVCSADPDSMWQWTSFNVISYEDCEFVVEKPQVSQTLGIGVFIAFAIVAWYSGLFKKIGKIFR